MEYLAGPIVVRAPASCANLGPGFDSLGLALSLADEVIAEIIPNGLEIEIVGEGESSLARDERNLIVRTMRATFEELGVAPGGLRLRCRDPIPHARGMGSSAAAIVAGVLAARALVVDADLDDAAALDLAARLDGHPDNVAACLLGGLTIAWQEAGIAAAVSCAVVQELALLPADAPISLTLPGFTAHRWAIAPQGATVTPVPAVARPR